MTIAMHRAQLLGIVMGLACFPAAAINKCPGADGKFVFQDMPCAAGGTVIEVKPASGYAAPPQDKPAPGVKSQTESQRMDALVEASQKERRRKYLLEQLLPEAEARVAAHKAACRQKAASYGEISGEFFQARAAKANAREKAAAMSECQMRANELAGELNALRYEARR